MKLLDKKFGCSIPLNVRGGYVEAWFYADKAGLYVYNDKGPAAIIKWRTLERIMTERQEIEETKQ